MAELEKIILTECRKNIRRFLGMTDVEIYEWICMSFYVHGNYEIARKCSRTVFEEALALRNRQLQAKGF